jgi:hypothetical protein
MNGKLPIRSLYTTLLILSAKAPKQKILAIDLLLGMCALWRTPYAGPWKGQGAAEIGKTGGAICGTGSGVSRVLGP